MAARRGRYGSTLEDRLRHKRDILEAWESELRTNKLGMAAGAADVIRQVREDIAELERAGGVQERLFG